MRSYPNVFMKASSYVYDYLKSINREDLIIEYDLEPFELEVQALERTFIDKLFAICDYYLDNKTNEHSRHIYDIFKISSIIKIDSNLKQLFLKVREERRKHEKCLSAQDNVNIKSCLQQIVDKDIYKDDFESITKSLIYEEIKYGEVKSNLQYIINSGLLD